MYVPLTAVLLIVALAPSLAQKIPGCADSKPPDIFALTPIAESGDPEAQLALGVAYIESEDPEKLSRAVYWFTKAAEQNNAEAEWHLVGVYGGGLGVTKDDLSAVDWLKRAAEDGQVQAQPVLALSYRDGRYVERDHQKAFDWFLRAAKQGDVDSQVSVAQMYEDGDAVSQDYAQAAKWYKKAAEHVPDRGGTGVAWNSLGYLYMEGNGVPQDYGTAYMYFALGQIKRNMQWEAEKMTSSQIAAAQRRAKEWIAKHPEPPECANSRPASATASAAD